MKRTLTLPGLLLCGLLWGVAGHAAEHNMRPGMWQLSTTSGLLALVPQLSDRQMQELRNLARQYGLAIPKIQNGAATSEICITPEMAERKIPPVFQHQQSGCEVRNAQRTGDRYEMDLVCTGAEISGTGRATGAFSSPERFSGRSEFNGIVHGAPINEQAETSGRWLRGC